MQYSMPGEINNYVTFLGIYIARLIYWIILQVKIKI